MRKLTFLFIFFLLSKALFALDKTAFHKKYIENYQTVALEEKIGQMLLIGFSGYNFSSEAKEYVQKYKVGGIILFNISTGKNREANINNPKQLGKLIQNIKKYSNIQPFIAVDQEGGKVSRLNKSNGFAKIEIPSHRALGDQKNTLLVYEEANKMSEILHKVGFNLNFAPSIDVNVNPNNPIIAQRERSFSSNPEEVASNAFMFIKGEEDASIIPAIKHFPGHGSSKNDSHLGFTDVSSTFKNYELEPYKKLIDNGYNGMVMTAHIYNKHIDNKYPASLSYKITTGILREKLGFKGVVITDDLKMKGITNNWDEAQSIILAINSGADILLYGNNLGDYNPDFVKNAVATIKNSLQEGKISMKRIDESYLRIMNLKYEYLYN